MLLHYVALAAFSIGFVGLVASVCLEPAPRLLRDPYAEVDWDSDLPLLTQFHDHAGGPNIVQTRIQAYDAAGYHAQALLHYSGCPWLAGAWREVRDPPEAWLSASVLASLSNTEVIFPSGEQACLGPHFTTPFLTHYIEAWDPARGSPPVKQPYQYATVQEGIDLARALGGMVFYGHPQQTHPPVERNFDGVEIFNAHSWNAYLRGSHASDPNENMVANWDALLEEDASILGIAVNDWLGPWRDPSEVEPIAIDSGKTLAFAHAATREDVRDAVERGAMLAVRDAGPVKGRYPEVAQITEGQGNLWIATRAASDSVRWIANGEVVWDGASLALDSLPAVVTYVRAEISNAEGSVVYTQAFAIAPNQTAAGR